MIGLFASATSVSESRPWFSTLFLQTRSFFEDFRKPPSPFEVTATPVEVEDIWSKQRTRGPRAFSLLIHLVIAGLLLAPRTTPLKEPPKGVINVTLYAPKLPTLPASSDPGGGGGGRDRTPPVLGKLPRAADRQFVPPDPTPVKNFDPVLIAEPTVIASLLPALPQLDLLNIGDPDGIPGPVSTGRGKGPGIGDGSGPGIGDGNGPGVGPGDGPGQGKPVPVALNIEVNFNLR